MLAKSPCNCCFSSITIRPPTAPLLNSLPARQSDTQSAVFCLSLFDGVRTHLNEIDERLAHAAENWRLPRMAAVDRGALRLGAYELLYTPDTPVGVVMDEAIELARRFGAADSPAFVNGVLDRLRKDAGGTTEPPAES